MSEAMHVAVDVMQHMHASRPIYLHFDAHERPVIKKVLPESSRRLRVESLPVLGYSCRAEMTGKMAEWVSGENMRRERESG